MAYKRFVIAVLLSLCILVVRANAAPTSVRADGVILRNNIPFYPFGFYYDGYNIPKSTRLADVATIAAGGFNVVATNIDNSDTELFDLCAKLNVGLLVEFNDPNDTVQQQVERWKTHPAVFGWQLADDVDNGRRHPNAVKALDTDIKTNHDATHITYVSGGHSTPGAKHDYIGNFKGVSDTVAMQSYPISSESLSATNSVLRKFYEAAPIPYPPPTPPSPAPNSAKAYLANCQAFRWPGQKPPTAGQVRNMTYQAYINGMKGIIYYTFRSDTWNLQADTTLWNQFQQLARENAALRDTLMNGTITRQVDTGAQRFNVFCSYWTYKGKLLIMFANATNKSRNVSITLPVGTTGTLVTKFPETPADMTFDNGTRIISGAVQGTKVHVYELNFS